MFFVFSFFPQFHNSDCLSTWLLHFIATNYLIFSQKPEFQELSGILLFILKGFCFSGLLRWKAMLWIIPFLHEKIIRVSLGYFSRIFHHPTVGSAHNMTQPALHHHFFGSYWDCQVNTHSWICWNSLVIVCHPLHVICII